ncbi:hypothetical protein B296_00021816 [Ensete ventricosum]|uniref:Uncharacterized protein n=1 Tax=Ensete ventricosum TaxID=4639 RepID=A0A426Y3H3_ENSVE|nr:hypothetical protein B296_00021816 [Ensete ventricosum]
MVKSYGGRAAAAAWGEGVARHTILMGVELGSVIPGHLHLGCLITCRPGPSGQHGFLRSVIMAVHLARAWTTQTGVKLRCQLNLFSSECASPPTSITLSGFPGVTSDFSYSSPGWKFHDPMVRRDHRPEFVERGPADDDVLEFFGELVKDEIEDGFIRLYHIRANPRSVMGKVRHISASEVVGSQKLEGIGLSRISGANGDSPLVVSPTSSFDMTKSLWTSSSLWLTWRSCSLTELVESEETTSGSSGVLMTFRERLVG